MRLSIVLLIAIAVLSSHARAQTSIWIGPSGGSWSDPNNWSPIGVPATGNNVTIFTTTPLSINMDYNGSASIGSVTTSGPIAFSGTGTLTVGFFSMDGATIASGTYNSLAGIDETPSSFSNGTIAGGTITTINFSNFSLNNASIQPGGTIFGGIDAAVSLMGIDNLNGGLITFVDDGRFYIEPNAVVNVNAPSNNGAYSTNDSGTLNVYAGLSGEGNYGIQGTAISAAVMSIYTGGGLNVTPGYDTGCEYDIASYGTVNQYGGYFSGGGYLPPPASQNPPFYAYFSLTIGGNGNPTYHLYDGTLHVQNLNVGVTILNTNNSSEGPGIFQEDGGYASAPNTTILAGSDMYLNGGSFTGSISNAGLLKIDSSVVLSIPQLTESTGSDLQLTSLIPTTSMIATTQASALAGELSIALLPNYTPAIGDMFDLISSPDLSGTFDSYDFPALADGLYWQPIYTPTNFSLQILPEPASAGLAVAIFIALKPNRRLSS